MLTENHSFSRQSLINLHLFPSLLFMLRWHKKLVLLHTWYIDATLRHFTVQAFANSKVRQQQTFQLSLPCSSVSQSFQADSLLHDRNFLPVCYL